MAVPVVEVKAGRCAQPGCGGEVTDGFCASCGMAPVSAGAVETCGEDGCGGVLVDGACQTCGEAVRAVTPAPDARCPRQGCDGVLSDGVCASCGLTPVGDAAGQAAPVAVPVGSAASVPHPRTGATWPDGGGSRGSTGSSRARRGMLGAGLVEVPPVPYRDPASAVMANPEVPEARRFCSRCDAEVGRARDGRPGRTEGFCRNCGHAFSFAPKLKRGDMVAGQYEVLGCLAHGGLGWVYLARDRVLGYRWVVLKGLLDTGDADSRSAATAERAFLAEVEHPNIVKIYNFARHEGAGYIVMEYVGGESLKEILLRRRREEGGDAALPLGQVIAYGLEVLRAFGYLHNVGLLYCDFKPDNAIQSEEQLKLIDLGGVRRAFDRDSPVFGTPGYQAPEISERDPSVTSDLYTVGRALAVLSFPFRGYTGRHLRSLPPRHEVPLLQRYESYDRLLRRATHPMPERRFQSAEEMADQLTGVLREVLAEQDGRPRPGPSTLFGPEPHAAGTPQGDDGPGGALAPLREREAASALPVPLVHDADQAAAFLGKLGDRDPGDLAAALAAAPTQTTEVRLALARVRVHLGDLDGSGRLLDELGAERPADWRIVWYRGVRALAAGDGAAAVRVFDGLYGLMPGETAPKLALAFALELQGDLKAADRYYETVWRTDPTHVSAAFGLARMRLAAGDRRAAESVLDLVPRISSYYVEAQLAAVAAAVRDRRAVDEAALHGAGRRLTALRLDTERRARFTADVLEAALVHTAAHPVPETPGAVLGVELRDADLRRALEDTYRRLAKLTGDAAERHRLVRAANRVRPRTLF